MTEFCKYWIGVTCAPESVVVVRDSVIGALIGIRNEDNTIQIVVIESKITGKIVGIGYTYEDCCIPVCYSYSEAAQVVAEKLGLLTISFTD